ncbi:hypothetical protein Apmu_0037_01 [Acidiphilium multivorum AIU301]|nr:hypothetical protein Apmu_0037_01 [Acidiphilium multivorum AIU301]
MRCPAVRQTENACECRHCVLCVRPGQKQSGADHIAVGFAQSTTEEQPPAEMRAGEADMNASSDGSIVQAGVDKQVGGFDFRLCAFCGGRNRELTRSDLHRAIIAWLCARKGNGQMIEQQMIECQTGQIKTSNYMGPIACGGDTRGASKGGDRGGRGFLALQIIEADRAVWSQGHPSVNIERTGPGRP